MKDKLDRKYLKKYMRKLMRCMNYTAKKMDKKNANPIYYEIYQLLSSHAWTDLAESCEHKFKVSKKHPMGRCTICGTIRSIK
ncbi:MAG TPA: hypothetical protein VI911_10220 [Patescibacteria group bacterium]|nr:hypothetical protein [Patescibacteria group bacterium]